MRIFNWRAWALFLGIFLLASGLGADVVTVNAICDDSICPQLVPQGLWSNPNTWTPAVVPNNGGGTTYAVNISFNPQLFRGGPSIVVAVDTSPTVNSVTVTGLPSPVAASATLEVLNGSTLTAGAVSQSGQAGGIFVDSGATLNANTLDTSKMSIGGTATIGSVSIQRNVFVGGGSLSVESGGLLNTGNISFSSDSGITVTGALTVGTGNLLPLAAQNTLVNNGQIAMNSGGLTIGGNGSCNGTCLASDATYDEVIDSSTSFGTLTTSPSSGISLDGTLDITVADSYVPAVGQTFVIMSALENPFGGQPISGTFANIEGQTFNNGTEMWDVQYTQSTPTTPGEVVLTAVPASVVPEPSLIVLTAFGLAGIVGLSRRRRGRRDWKYPASSRSRTNTVAP